MRHYHVIDPESHPDNRTVYYHDHPASFVFDPGGNIVHDHKTDPATYVNEK